MLRGSQNLRLLLLSIIAWGLIASSHAGEAFAQKDLMGMKHVHTCAKKGTQLWGIVYGLRENNEIAYVVFYDGNKPSPFITGTEFHHDGKKSFFLTAQHNGKKIDKPDREQNILIIGDQVTRGHMNTLSDAEFKDYLKKTEAFSLTDLINLGKQTK